MVVIKKPDEWGFDISYDKRRNIAGEVKTDKWLNIGDELLIKGHNPHDYTLKCEVIAFEDGWACITARPKDFNTVGDL